MAIDPEDLEPKKRVLDPLGADLSRLSIEELEARIAALEEEIVRCRGAIDGKRKTRDSAESVFKR